MALNLLKLKLDQTDLTANEGNALQACVASILCETFDSVPNFIKDKRGYTVALNEYLEPKHLAFMKIKLDEQGGLPFPCLSPNVLCIVAGKSPRGDHKHCVVGHIVSYQVELIHDPHPDRSMIETKEWAAVFVSTKLGGMR